MNTVKHTVTLKSKEHFGHKAPPQPLGEILRLLPVAVSRAVRMAFEGRSTARGTTPGWLQRISDIRLVGYQGKDDTQLHFACPTAGAAAPELYEQRQFEWSPLPSPDDTGFDLLGDVIADLSSHNVDSDRFDRPMLQYLSRFKNGINGTFQEIVFAGHRITHPATIDASVIRTAREFSSETPNSEPVRIAGTLDMIRASTQAFAVKLESGEEIRGVLLNGQLESVSQLLAKRVLVLGKAVYRPSGRLLRVDAENLRPASEADAFFSRIPAPSRKKLDVRQIIREQTPKRGLAAIIGQWPGDETDEEIEVALRDLS
jgi:hypothetical protein